MGVKKNVTKKKTGSAQRVAPFSKDCKKHRQGGEAPTAGDREKFRIMMANPKKKKNSCTRRDGGPTKKRKLGGKKSGRS